MDLNLKGKVALITGGASGIGWAIAKEFAKEGADTVLWDRSPEVVGQAQLLASESGTTSVGLVVDIVQEDAVRGAFAETVVTSGVPFAVIHAAAIGSGKFGFPFTNLQPIDWHRVLDVNIMGMVNVAHIILPALRERRQGAVVFIASVAGQMGSQTDPPYSATKAANINFSQCLAKDLASHNVRVNTVCPGMVQTPLNRGVWQAWYDQQPENSRKSYEEWAGEKIRNVVPLGRWQKPEDIAHMVVFLASEKASEVTGQTVNVDGGFVMHW